MTMTYTQLSELNNSLDSELGDIYTHNLRLLDANHLLAQENIKLVAENALLKQQIKRGKLQ